VPHSKRAERTGVGGCEDCEDARACAPGGSTEAEQAVGVRTRQLEDEEEVLVKQEDTDEGGEERG